LDHDIKGILDMGVEAQTNKVLGRDFTVAGLLQEGYDAVLLTSGGFDSRKILLPDQKNFNATIGGFYTMLDFLMALAKGENIRPGRHAVIVHSGLKALELARKCRELGAEKVTIVTYETFDLLPMEFRDVKRLRDEEIEVSPATVVAAMGGISGQLARIATEPIEPIGENPTKGEIKDADTLIVSSARLPELLFVHADGKPESPDDELKWQTVETFRTFPDGMRKGVFASPEPGRISDASAVVKSILSGRRLARAVHQHFTDGPIIPIKNLTCQARDIPNVSQVSGVSPSERRQPSFLDVEGNSKTAWVFPKEFPGLGEAAAREEAGRCLQCGLICYEKTGVEESEKKDV
jgi:NADPH-dependent glutamate synthase beta subunit-like oxidoreductase